MQERHDEEDNLYLILRNFQDFNDNFIESITKVCSRSASTKYANYKTLLPKNDVLKLFTEQDNFKLINLIITHLDISFLKLSINFLLYIITCTIYANGNWKAPHIKLH